MKKRTLGRVVPFCSAERESVTISVALFPDGGSMRVRLGDWEPVYVNMAIDPEARTLAEGVRQLVVAIMENTLKVPV